MNPYIFEIVLHGSDFKDSNVSIIHCGVLTVKLVNDEILTDSALDYPFASDFF